MTSEEKKRLEDSIHLRAVKYGVKYPHGFSIEQIRKWYEQRPQDWSVISEFLYAARKNKDAGFNLVTPFLLLEKKHGSAIDEYMLSYEAYFNYLDYLELVEARKNARSAKWYAIAAIAIAVVTTLVSIHYSRKEIQSQTEMETGQYQRLIETIKNK